MKAEVDALRRELADLSAKIDRRMQFMEVCGTHTVSAFRSGLRSMLPDNVRLVSGPGCPVCVTAQRHIDAAIELASIDNVIIATYGDMVRVPGQLGSLEQRRAQGARVRVVNSARQSIKIATQEPDAQVVFLGVGFETTAPATAATVLEAEKLGLKNLSVLMCHKLVMPAMMTLLQAGDVPLDGFLCPGHVSVIIGASAYRPVVDQYGKGCVVAGFEAPQMLKGLVHLVRQVVEARHTLENVYSAVVSDEGNPTAVALMNRIFVEADAPWRELGVIPLSGLELAAPYRQFDALERFGIELGEDKDNPGCICGEVIQGKAEPADCPLFGHGCTPLEPVGPCMVSSEGTCAAWYKYNRFADGRCRGAAGAKKETNA